MRISIIGPSGSGKTTLAWRLSSLVGTKPICLDSVCFEIKDKKRRSLCYEEYMEKLKPSLQGKSWIIEGLQPVEEVFNLADVIIWLKPNIFTSFFRQWKRYIKDTEQREKYGFKNNLRLSVYIMRQYLGNPNEKTDPKKTWLKSVAGVLRKYSGKTLILTNSSEKENFLSYAISKNSTVNSAVIHN